MLIGVFIIHYENIYNIFFNISLVHSIGKKKKLPQVFYTIYKECLPTPLKSCR